jgi:pre-mRNA-splicing factor CDC5/CEF1
MINALKLEFEAISEASAMLTKKADKVEQKLTIKYGGYEKKAKDKRAEIVQMVKDAADAKIERAVYERLASMEGIAIPKRIAGLQEEIDVLSARQTGLQSKYAALASEKQALEAA